jgi:hypothetical protein
VTLFSAPGLVKSFLDHKQKQSKNAAILRGVCFLWPEDPGASFKKTG